MVRMRKAKYGVVSQIDRGTDTIDEATVTRVDASKIGDGDTDSTKLEGFFTTRNNADSSMYIPVAATSGYERGFKICYAPVSNDGGYFDSLYVNTKVASTSTPSGTLRALEAKVTVEGNCGANAEAVGVYGKINVSGASAEVSNGIGVDVLLEEESSGTLTVGTGMRVQGTTAINSEVVDIAVDLSGNYKQGAIKLPVGATDTNGVPNAAAAVAVFGTAANKAPSNTFFMIGGYKDTHSGGNLYGIFAYNGAYYAVDLGDALS